MAKDAAGYDQLADPFRFHQPLGETLFLSCCDCGLVHAMRFKMIRGRLYIFGKRDPSETRHVRRLNASKLKKKRRRR